MFSVPPLLAVVVADAVVAAVVNPTPGRGRGKEEGGQGEQGQGQEGRQGKGRKGQAGVGAVPGPVWPSLLVSLAKVTSNP